MNRRARTALWLGLGLCSLLSLLLPSTSGPQGPAPASVIRGESTTLLSDGRWLRLGGEGPDGVVATAEIVDPHTGTSVRLSSGLRHARAWHSATVMPDGRVLILGGIGANGHLVESAERFDPASGTFDLVATTALTARAGHSVTLLIDGRLLVVGGVSADGRLLEHGELLDPDTGTAVLTASLTTPRVGHTATLLASGAVLIWGGTDAAGDLIADGELYDSDSAQLTPISNIPGDDARQPELTASMPDDGTTGVSTVSRVALHFSSPMNVDTITADHVVLTGPDGVVGSAVNAAEGGRLAFVIPEHPLAPGATYAVTLSDLTDETGRVLPPTQVRFTTQAVIGPSGTGNVRSAGAPSSSPAQGDPADADDEDWLPDALRNGKWRTNYPPSPWQSLPPLQAPDGVTALAGQALTLKGDPLPDVTLKIAGLSVQTDSNGQFLLQGLPAGPQEMLINGRTANRPGRTYGVFEVGVKLTAGLTTVLPYTIWMPQIDTAHAVKIPSPTTTEVVVTTPKIHGLEVRIPAGAVLRDVDGQVVTEISITPVPTDRPPFPLARNVEVPVYFTIQPGATYISKGIRVIYPNTERRLPGERHTFWRYQTSEVGWSIYGLATVTEDGKQIVPDPGVLIYEFTGVMLCGGGPWDHFPVGDSDGGDPVNLATGLFVLRTTDLFLPDVIPIALTRTYIHRDHTTRPFGIGASHPYAIFLWSANPYQEATLIQADGSQIQFVRTSPGVGFEDAVFETTATPTAFFKSRMVWNGNGWDLTLKDGTVYVFGENAPLQAIRDRYGNQLTISHANGQSGNITKITSPNNRWIAFTYDASNRITLASDNIGRTVSYAYNASSELVSVTDPAGGVTQYTYEADGSHRMITLRDPRGNVKLENYYDQNRVARQETGGSEANLYRFSYTTDANGNIIQTDVTDPRGTIHRTTFNTDGYSVTDTLALGLPEQQTTTYTRQTGTNLVLSEIDALGRQTSYTYDTMGNIVTITRASGTPQAATTTYSYEPTFNKIASVTDPLNHTTAFSYDARGNPASITNPVGQSTTFTYTTSGQLTSATDALGNTTQISYDGGDSVGETDPLGNTTRRFFDAVGRLSIISDPLGRQTAYERDALDRLTRVTDALAGATIFNYDGNSNLLNITDSRGNAITYTYDSLNRVAIRSDPLTHAESYAYDSVDNPTIFTDRKGQLATRTYDALNRLVNVTYTDSSTAYTWDKGDRLTTITDSISGSITRTHDDLDRLTQETTAQGTVAYTYDSAGRRTSMTVNGQVTVNYTYDAADRLTQILSGASAITIGYDAAGQRTSLTLPNGVTQAYTYDVAGRLTAITYTRDGTLLGDLAYTYDAASRRVQVGGSFARTGIPQAVAAATYNAANQQILFDGQALTYDLNSNLVNDGVRSYTWNARNQLVSVTGGGLTASFTYDGLGRRQTRTINGTTTTFAYDRATPIREVNADVATMLTGLGVDEFFTRTDAGGPRTFLTDALGSTLALTDDMGAIQTQYTYEPFGSTTVGGAASANVFAHAGRENDGTGLHYYRARYYYPRLQRFLGEDPIGCLRGSLNLFTYVKNDPIDRKDPSGEISIPGELFGEIIKELLGHFVIRGVGGAAGATCASNYCRRGGRSVDFVAAGLECASVFQKHHLPADNKLFGECIDSCIEIASGAPYRKCAGKFPLL